MMRRGYRQVLIGLLCAYLAAGTLIVQAETGLAAAGQVVSDYLDGLANGDTERLIDLLDEGMKARNRQLVLEPEYYGEFLRTHYAGVAMIVETLDERGKVVQARVRFDYPDSGGDTITFILRQVDGEWKISNEIF